MGLYSCTWISRMSRWLMFLCPWRILIALHTLVFIALYVDHLQKQLQPQQPAASTLYMCTSLYYCTSVQDLPTELLIAFDRQLRFNHFRVLKIGMKTCRGGIEYLLMPPGRGDWIDG